MQSNLCIFTNVTFHMGASVYPSRFAQVRGIFPFTFSKLLLTTGTSRWRSSRRSGLPTSSSH